MPCAVRLKRFTVTSSPSRATTIWPFFASLRLLHREQVAVHDAGVAHAHAAHLEQVVGPAREHARFHQDRSGRCAPARGSGCPPRRGRPAAARAAPGSAAAGELLAARLVERAQCVRLQADAARGAADQLDHALARQRLQVLLGRVGRTKAELGGDLGARRRRAGALDRALHEVEDLLLAVGEFRASLAWSASSRLDRP